MAKDQITEQIGLAISADGNSFVRVGDGLILPIDPAVPWKSLRTCNPTVLQEDGRFLMFYQGVSAEREISIGVATSRDGIDWQCDEDPALTADASANILQTSRYGTTDLIEPAVLRVGDEYRMWFISRGSREPGNRMHHAVSANGRKWQIDRANLLAGMDFGPGCRIHYPQVVASDGGYWIHLSVRKPNGRFSVLRAFSSDGFAVDAWENVTRPDCFASFASRALNKLKLRESFYSHGLAHSHRVVGDSVDRTYFHAYHLDRRRRTYMDVVSVESWDPLRINRAFDRAADPAAWDAWFVADPFVLLVS